MKNHLLCLAALAALATGQAFGAGAESTAQADTLAWYVEYRQAAAPSEGSDTGIEINEENFPDEAFRTYLKTNTGTSQMKGYGSDGVLTPEEIAGITAINISKLGVKDTKGLEFFTALKTLNCFSNPLTSLDVSANKQLTYLDCQDAKLQKLDLSQNTALTYLDCRQNPITELNIDACTGLTSLYCSKCSLKVLDLTHNAKLEKLNCHTNQLSALDLSNCTALERVWCYGNAFVSLDFSHSPSLKYIECENNRLQSVDFGNCASLETLYCGDNRLSAIDLSPCASLAEAHLNGQKIDAAVVKLSATQNGIQLSADADGSRIESVSVGKNGTTAEVVSQDGKKYLAFPNDVDIYGTTVTYRYNPRIPKLPDSRVSVTITTAGSTGIKQINAAAGDSAVYYDLSGRKVSKPVARQVYIHNGKKAVYGK